jgi:hypothetical protein
MAACGRVGVCDALEKTIGFGALAVLALLVIYPIRTLTRRE